MVRRGPRAVLGCLTLMCVGIATLIGSTVEPAEAATLSGPLVITTTSLNSGEVGATYSQRLGATGGSTPYSWSTASPLPAGLSLSASGVLSGTPQVPIDEAITITAMDATGLIQITSLELDVIAGPSITTIAIPSPTVGESYATQLSAIGGVPPYTWSVNSGPLPLGLVLNSTGLVSGLPSTPATTTTTIALIDAGGARVTAPFTVSVAPSLLAPATYMTTSTRGAVSAYASPGVRVPQTAEDGPNDVVGIAANAAATHYWLVTAAGQVSSSPGTRSFGSVAPKKLSGRIVGIAALANGAGYWLASSTGYVYGFGAERALPERGRIPINPNVVAIAADPKNNGYWLVTRAGRVYAFGSAGNFGSIPAARHVRSTVGIAPSPDGRGYWVVTRNGTLAPFGSASALAAVEVDPGTNVIAIASAA